MAQDIKVAEKTCLIPTFERNRYFFGKPMTVHDFEAEQQYGIGKSRLLNRLIHGTGILCGMQLSKPKIADGKFTVEISEGAALDCCGNLIVANRTETVEVKGDLVEGANYLYVKFAECVRQPIMASANVSSCEEVCCYNRIRETFEVFVASKPLANPTFTGAVKRGDGRGIVGARVEALQAGIVLSETLTNNNGNFTLEIASSRAASQFEVRASATGFSPWIKPNQTVAASPLSDFVLLPQAGAAPANVCQEVTQRYFDEHSSVCPRCDDPRVFVAVANVSEETVTIDQTESARVRAVLYSNPMLHDLLCEHLADFNNPHRTTAEQILALQSINNVGNGPGKPYTANITLGADATIGITSDSDNERIDLKLANDAVKPNHLHNDTIRNLLGSDGTIAIEPNTGSKRIVIKTNPAASVSSVAATKVVGISTRFSPDDHTHDLANGVVSKPKLAEDVINTLVASDGTITVTPDPAARQIGIKTNPATDVTSVGRTKDPGKSLNFARQDHRHNLQLNESGPDENGRFVLTPGPNIQIVGRAANELVISAGTSETFRVTTGVVRFADVKVAERRTSGPIRHELNTATFAIVLGLDSSGAIEGGDAARLIEIGDLSAIHTQAPLLVARYAPGAEAFVVILRDTRSPQISDPPITYLVSWWAIPSSGGTGTEVDRQPGLTVSPELIDAVLNRVQSLPGKTIDELAESLNLRPDLVQPVIDHLKVDGSIKETSGRFFPPGS